MPVWIAIVLLGIVEGITEFLPVSSTGHLLIAEHWLPRQSDLFNIVIQSGATLAVIPLFWGRISRFFTKFNDPETFSLLLKVIVAFGITGAGVLVLEKLKKKGFSLTEELGPVGWALLIGGFLFLAIEWSLKGKKLGVEVTWTIAIAVGLGQLVAAFFPGASRSGTTIMFSLLLGLGRPMATEFSFLVGIPTMLAAGCYKMFKTFHHAVIPVQEDWGMLVLATVVSAVVAFIAVKWLLRFVQSHTFNGFGWYRVAVGAAVLALLR
jgi:undecaprenyl-diphosphatase